MNSQKTFHAQGIRKARLIFLGICMLWIISSSLAGMVQRDFGNVAVENVSFENTNNLTVRAKLFIPHNATEMHPVPGIVYVHGYQNNRETSDPYCIELARRGVAALCIDALGRGNSDNQMDINAVDYDPSSGTAQSLQYLRELPYVDSARTALMGHSLGAGMVYDLALKDETLKALVISGFGYTLDASTTIPQNMLMIFGKYDEYRDRMTHTDNFETEWMQSAVTRQVFPVEYPVMGQRYGDFADGSARMVYMPLALHFQESHDAGAVAAAVDWITQALEPEASLMMPSDQQIWHFKEYATLISLLCAVLCVLPLGYLLLSSPYFAELQQNQTEIYVCTGKERMKFAVINGGLMLLYLGLVLTLFGFHMYVVPIDKIFPMMMVNGVAFWFVMINLAGYFLFRRWRKKNQQVSLLDLGVSDEANRFLYKKQYLLKSLLVSVILFGFVYAMAALLENIFIVDLRFIFPFASDFTFYRFLMFLLYLPFFFLGFWQMGIFLHAQIRPKAGKNWFTNFVQRTILNWAVMLIPLLIHLAIQYIPIYLGGTVPFVGPSAALVGFVMNLFHMVVVLLLIIPVSTYFSELTGKIYLGAMINAMLVTWMFTSSSVIAPIPV
ncbi:MAG: alpha/beta hydrolase [Anaerolineaceae bacterium]|nr:alpha/beta hydrolase [Anaerolineaceae bacterium]